MSLWQKKTSFKNIKPRKILGQNFLVDKNIIKKVIKTANLKPKDIVLEVGPGFGALTEKIILSAKKIVAVEKDDKLSKILQEKFEKFENIKIINKDILKLNISDIRPPKKARLQNYKLVANLPFYAGSRIIRMFLELKNPPEEMVLIVQKEVAQRICARPPRMNLLAVSVQALSKPKIISYVPKKCFKPKPKVDGAIIKIVPRKRKKKSKKRINYNDNDFFKIIKAGFSHPRKKLANNLSGELKLNKQKIVLLLSEQGIGPNQRAETLDIESWINLAKKIKKEK